MGGLGADDQSVDESLKNYDFGCRRGSLSAVYLCIKYVCFFRQ